MVYQVNGIVENVITKWACVARAYVFPIFEHAGIKSRAEFACVLHSVVGIAFARDSRKSPGCYFSITLETDVAYNFVHFGSRKFGKVN